MPIVEEATTQYGDMNGTVAMDFHRGSIADFAKTCGLDTERYQPVALEVWPVVNAGDVSKRGLGIRFYVLETGDYGTKIIQNRGGDVTVGRVEACVSYDHFFRHMKRFEMVAKYKTLPADIKIQFNEDDQTVDLGWITPGK